MRASDKEILYEIEQLGDVLTDYEGDDDTTGKIKAQIEVLKDRLDEETIVDQFTDEEIQDAAIAAYEWIIDSNNTPPSETY
jgi:hypothetical protein